MALLSITDVFLLIAAIACVWVGIRRRSSSALKLPPGPPRLPLLGNLLQVDPARPYPQFLRWAQQYGDVFYLRLGLQDVVVLNTAQAADDVLTGRSKVYSGRVAPHVAHEILSEGQRVLFMPYAREWKIARRAMSAAAGPAAAKRIREFQDMESRTAIYDLMCHGAKIDKETSVASAHDSSAHEVPEGHWFHLIRRFSTSVPMYVTYGKRVNRIVDNPQMDKVYDVVANFTRMAQPGNYLADVVPLLRKLPDWMSPWRVEAKSRHEWEMGLFGGLLDEEKAALRSGTVRDTFLNTYLRGRAASGHAEAPGRGLAGDVWMRDKMLAYTAGSLLEAGADTTATALLTFVLAMLGNPGALQRAREEVDAAVGAERMPAFEDEERLPYVVACIQETLRCHPPVIMGVPHRADEDDEYKGYHIPKGATVIGNLWAIHMDPVRYPDPTKFMPERHLGGPPLRRAGGPDPEGRAHYAFGFGRRFCGGKDVAEASLFILCARLLWGVDFRAPADPATGKPRVPDFADEDGTWTTGFIAVPKLYDVEFAPRSEKCEAIIRRSFEELQDEWKDMGLPEDER
ncbi:cytochrome P450 [Obba rivulosa]|uniref:Cytochrome P450 n=1 Tax=Obba rivulosa TaxID=1052685 RepID=A0A8E2DNB6_9APHY|nr:cytochrome P450 [Obba rivulosa]